MVLPPGWLPGSRSRRVIVAVAAALLVATPAVAYADEDLGQPAVPVAASAADKPVRYDRFLSQDDLDGIRAKYGR